MKPKSVLEIGAGNGHALFRMNKLFDCISDGIEPSKLACEYGNQNFRGIKLYIGSAEEYPEEIKSNKYELVVFGGVLFHLPPHNFFKAISNALEVIEDNGYLMIFDFHNQGAPIYRKYKHEENQYVYKYNHEKVLSAHPSFRLVYAKTLQYHEKHSSRNNFDTLHYAALWKFSPLETFSYLKDDPT